MMRIIVSAILLLSVSSSFGQALSDSTFDDISYSIRVGTYVQVPDSVKALGEHYKLALIPGRTCDDGRVLSKVEISSVSSLGEAEVIRSKILRKGYKEAFIIPYNGRRRIAWEEVPEEHPTPLQPRVNN